MDVVEVVFLKELKSYLHKEESEIAEDYDKIVIEKVLQLANDCTIFPMIYHSLGQEYLTQLFDGQEQSMLKNKMLFDVIVSTNHTQSFLLLYDALRKSGLHPVVLKGIICRELYPDPEYRASSDEDILIPIQELSHCREVMAQYGYAEQEESSRLSEDELLKQVQDMVFYNPRTNLHIELHINLFSPIDPIGKVFNTYFADPFSMTTNIMVQRVEILTLSCEKHLLYLLLHFYRHFINKGIGIRQVVDIVLFTQKYAAEINWNTFDDMLKNLKLQRLYASLLQIGEQYLAIGCENVSKRYRRFYPDSNEDLLQDILSGGIYGRTDLTRKYTASILLRKVEERYEKKNIILHYSTILFPSSSYMRQRYPWTKKTSLLIPVAWFCRLGREGIRLIRQKRGESSMVDGIYYERKRREELFRKYGVL